MGDVALKKRLAEILESTIRPIREKRQKLAKNPKAVMRILEKGTEHARTEAAKTMHVVRKAMKIDYL